MQAEVPKALMELRQQIDAIDGELLDMLARRFAVTWQVGELKAELGLDSVDPVREQQKLERLREQALARDLDAAFVSSLFQYIFDEVVKNHQSCLQARQSGS